MTDLLEPLASSKGLRLLNEVPAGLPMVKADEDRLQQILHNLVGNAIRYSTRGQIVVSASISSETDMILEVSDQGPGIPPDRLETIFESFEGGTDSQAGTGLGLTISRRLVELLGGRIWCESQVGMGSSLFFTLPRAVGLTDPAVNLEPRPESKEPSGSFEVSARVREAVEAETVSLSLHHRSEFTGPDSLTRPGVRFSSEGGRILVVDDDHVNLHVITNFLTEAGHAVRVALNGDDALEQLRDGFDPDLVVLDVMMPGMSGFELCRRLRLRSAAIDLPIVFLTARAQPEDVAAGLEAGANDYLSKPIAREELMARIGACLRMKRLASDKVALEKVAFRDQLTGLANRRRLNLAISELEDTDAVAGRLVALHRSRRLQDDQRRSWPQGWRSCARACGSLPQELPTLVRLGGTSGWRRVRGASGRRGRHQRSDDERSNRTHPESSFAGRRP